MKQRQLWMALVWMAHLWMNPNAFAQKNKIELTRVEPMNWWTQMTHPELQLLVQGKGISATEVKLTYPGVTLQQVIRVENPNYLFLNLFVAPQTQPGSFAIEFVKDKKTVVSYTYSLRERAPGSRNRVGFNPSDAVYLLMPDRFANGDPQNDDMPGMLEKADRNAPYGRHGGDLKGIANHLDFIASLGMTAIWLNPVQENNMPASSYHGYAITDYYHIDARFGSNQEFKNFVTLCNQKGIKVIMDMVFNHCGTSHWWMNDLPSADWLNQWKEFTRSNYRLSTISDPHAAQSDYALAAEGWFDTSMADLNLRNPLMLNYLIQNSIWWIEYAGLGGIRQDTYPYPDKEGMAIWAKRVMEEYPNFNIVGEAWISHASKLCYWAKDFPNKDGFNSYLPSLMDFPLQEAIARAFNEQEGWDTGLTRLYDVLADDHLYPDPLSMMTFAENHDVGRILHQLHGNTNSLKMAMTFLATTRGIPHLYYGTEILMDGNGFDGHSLIRLDMPGGWAGDEKNVFTGAGISPEQKAMVDHISKIFQYRKQNKVLQYGTLRHFIPQNNVYVYFRQLEGKTIMVILNNNQTAQTLSGVRYNEVLKNYVKGKEVLTGKELPQLQTIEVPATSALVIELL